MKKFLISVIGISGLAGLVIGYAMILKGAAEISDLALENIEALTSGEGVQVVGCYPYKGATCYVFDSRGLLVDKVKNAAPRE